MSTKNVLPVLASLTWFILFLFCTQPQVLSKSGKPKVYGVIFGILINENGDLVNYRIADVIDSSKKKVTIEISNEYYKQAGELIKNKGYKSQMKDGKAVEFFTYFVYDPRTPDKVLLEIPKE
jgi:hypothetical protein